MAKETEKRVAVDRKSEDNSYDYANVLKQLIASEKADLENIKQQVVVMNARLQSAQVQITNDRAEFEGYKNREKKALEDLKNAKKNEFNLREHQLNDLEVKAELREKVLSSREEEIVKKIEINKGLIADRIEVEQLKAQAVIELKNAKMIKDEADNQLNQIAVREALLAQKEKDVKSIDSNLNFKQEQLEKLEKSIAEREKNIEAVKLAIEPELAKLKEKSESITFQLKELDAKKEELTLKTEEYAKITEGIERREENLKNKAIELATIDGELRRRELLVSNLEK